MRDDGTARLWNKQLEHYAQPSAGAGWHKDVAEIVDGAENERLAAWANENQAVLLNIQRQPGANVIEACIAELQLHLQRGVKAITYYLDTLKAKQA